MVARPGTYLASNNAGELKPELHGRTDLKQFYAGLAYGRNIEPVAQGGSRLSPRTVHVSRIRGGLNTLTPLVSASPAGVAVAGTLALVDFGSPKALTVAVVSSIKASRELGKILQLQYLVDGVWIPMGSAFGAGSVAKTRSAARPPRVPVTTRMVRLQLLSAPPAPTDFFIENMFGFSEVGSSLVGRVIPFTFSIEQTYEAVLTHNFIDFYRDDVWVGGSISGVSSNYIAAATFQQRFDTLTLFHENVPSCRITRDGADDSWVFDILPFTEYPQVDLGGVYTNQVADVWQVYIRFPMEEGDFQRGAGLLLNFTVNGEETGGIGVGGTSSAADWPGFCAALKAAIEGLPSIGPGIDVISDNAGGGGANTCTVTITFTGDDNLGSVMTFSAQVVNTSNAAATVSHQVTGRPGGENLFGPSQGYAACGLFYQDRLVTGGFRSKRGALLASVTGDYFNCNILQVAASGAILTNLDTDGAERIIAMARARHLVIFTSDAEYYVSDRALSKTTIPTIVNSSRNGSLAGIGAVENEGALLYVSRNNALIYAATYDDVSAAYVSAPISLLASHIASNVTGMAMQRASTATDAGRLLLPRIDGTMTLGTMLRGENVTGFTRWETAGLVRSAAVNGKNNAYLLVERTVGGVQEMHLERMALGEILDDVVKQTFPVPTSHITGLGAHEGAAVWAVADGYVEGPFTVAGGAIDIATSATQVSVGRWTPPIADTLPLPSEVSERVVLRRPKRVHTVKLDLIDTTSVAVGANGLAPKEVALARAGDPLNAPQAPVNRTVPVTGLRGFSDAGQVRITQTRPGLLAWRGITIEART
ncbi:hypothetical protein [Tardiphaga sp.]|jgi:hypothetical protein|uniref:hypothetical protein n=1 Tax=Tardiphaga sp. TaxID=1926292 RepID=UPI0037D9CCC8